MANEKDYHTDLSRSTTLSFIQQRLLMVRSSQDRCAIALVEGYMSVRSIPPSTTHVSVCGFAFMVLLDSWKLTYVLPILPEMFT